MTRLVRVGAKQTWRWKKVVKHAVRVQHILVEEFCHKSPAMGQGNPVLLGNGSLVLPIFVMVIVRPKQTAERIGLRWGSGCSYVSFLGQ